MFLIMVHIAAVIRVETKEGGGIISAMFTGRKLLNKAAADDDRS
jgi:cytochrome b